MCISSNSQKRIADLEKQQAESLMPPPAAAAGTPSTQPRSVVSPPSPATPATPAGDPLTPLSTPTSEGSPLSVGSSASSLTPSLSQMSLGRRRGRPRKAVTKPTYDDFPIDGTTSEQERWVRAKNTEVWRYKKLTSDDAETYRKAENERVKAAYVKKKVKGEVEDADDIEGVEQLPDEQETDVKKEKIKEQSRQR